MKNGYHFPVSLLLKKTHTHTSQLTNQNKVVNFFLPTEKKINRDVHISTKKTQVWTFANLSFWRSESLLKFNAIGRASTKSLRSMQTVGKSGKKRFKHYTQTTCSALLSDPFVTFEHDLPEKCARTHTNTQSIDRHCQTVGFCFVAIHV